MDNLVPVVLFTYNRLSHTEETVYSLSKCAEAKDTTVYVFMDAPKDETQLEKVNQVKKFIYGLKEKKLFKEIVITEREFNFGLAKSIRSGVSEVFERYDALVVLEDDCKVSPYFLSYMNNALKFYENIPFVGSISSYIPNIEIPKDYKYDVVSLPRTCSLGWGTWKKYWDEIDWELKDISKYRHNLSFILKMNKCGSDRFSRLLKQLKFNINSWSVLFGYNQLKKGYTTIYPKYSYIFHTGNDGSGVHSNTSTDLLDIDLDKAIETPVFTEVAVDNRICKEMHKKFSGNILRQIFSYVYVFGGDIVIDKIKKSRKMKK